MPPTNLRNKYHSCITTPTVQASALNVAGRSSVPISTQHSVAYRAMMVSATANLYLEEFLNRHFSDSGMICLLNLSVCSSRRSWHVGAMGSYAFFYLAGLYPVPATRQYLLSSPYFPRMSFFNPLFNTTTTIVANNFAGNPASGVGGTVFVKVCLCDLHHCVRSSHENLSFRALKSTANHGNPSVTSSLTRLSPGGRLSWTSQILLQKAVVNCHPPFLLVDSTRQITHSASVRSCYHKSDDLDISPAWSLIRWLNPGKRNKDSSSIGECSLRRENYTYTHTVHHESIWRAAKRKANKYRKNAETIFGVQCIYRLQIWIEQTNSLPAWMWQFFIVKVHQVDVLAPCHYVSAPHCTGE